jgi:hypothetical protein
MKILCSASLLILMIGSPSKAQPLCSERIEGRGGILEFRAETTFSANLLVTACFAYTAYNNQVSDMYVTDNMLPSSYGKEWSHITQKDLAGHYVLTSEGIQDVKGSVPVDGEKSKSVAFG